MRVFIVLVIIAVAFIIFIFNSLVAKKNRILNIAGSIDALLKKRFDLIPNLVNTVKGYMTHERTLLEDITNARAKAMQSSSSETSRINLDAAVTPLLDKILVAVENYPDLKASTNFLHLQKTLVELEEQISAARRAYNSAVADYNNAVQMFPSNIIASAFNYQTKEFFHITPTQRLTPDAGRILNS